ncbi:hypothetical protein FZC79_06850 [Rossellomorea vietnamensis]|uniref:Uncharacterized protein n=2 Tax=Rossellomorea TaxID=2837508 RepID=A0A5D4KH44_9BACI|nr:MULTISPECIES: hypothetical protein [Rossellomorea]TYR76587.1 hypothetical protein FZC79_06850 [Rossellomorea vietnamensis]TYS79411.1 hypothetical protein FZC80_10905 [Rossellomorea aquimaris]
MAKDINELVKHLQEMNSGSLNNLLSQQQRTKSQRKLQEDFKKNQESMNESLKNQFNLSDYSDLNSLLDKLK